MQLITSRNNPKIKQIRALRQRKSRQEMHLFLVEGIHPVGEAVQAKASLDSIVYAPEVLESEFAQRLVDEQRNHGVPCYETSAEVFDALADKENPQGILAVVRQPEISLADLSPDNFSWGVALVSPQDPGNVGTILRTIDAVGANGLLLLESSVDPYHPSAVRASMGALFWYPVVSTSFVVFSHWADRHGYHLYGTSSHVELDYRRVKNYNRPCILVMGSERQGLTPDQAIVCERMLRLPMHGRASSLNLAVATGILLYDMLEKF